MKTNNQYKDQKVHPGSQPIRVLCQNVINSFENVYLEFKLEVKDFYKNFKLEEGIPYIIGPYELSSQTEDVTPFVTELDNGNKVIYLSETFFSYLWCVTYALCCYFHEYMYIPSREHTYSKMNINVLTKASMLLEYPHSLIAKYTPWKKNDLPNPEIFSNEEKFFIGMANHGFAKATTFVLCHEVSHAIKGHLDVSDTRSVLEQEIEHRTTIST